MTRESESHIILLFLDSFLLSIRASALTVSWGILTKRIAGHWIQQATKRIQQTKISEHVLLTRRVRSTFGGKSMLTMITQVDLKFAGIFPRSNISWNISWSMCLGSIPVKWEGCYVRKGPWICSSEKKIMISFGESKTFKRLRIATIKKRPSLV